jgi:hypothetical protein
MARDVDKSAFHALYNDKDAIEQEFGEKLEWQELLGRKASRIALYRYKVNPSDASQTKTTTSGCWRRWSGSERRSPRA